MARPEYDSCMCSGGSIDSPSVATTEHTVTTILTSLAFNTNLQYSGLVGRHVKTRGSAGRYLPLTPASHVDRIPPVRRLLCACVAIVIAWAVPAGFVLAGYQITVVSWRQNDLQG